VKVRYQGRTEVVYLLGNENIGMIKTSLSSTLGIPLSRQILIYDGEVLDDSKLASVMESSI
jgi:hypothetical protein